MVLLAIAMRERDERLIDRLIQKNLDGREGTAMLGTKRGRSRRLSTPPAPREVVSLHSDYNPTAETQKSFRGVAVVFRISPVAIGTRKGNSWHGRSRLKAFLGGFSEAGRDLGFDKRKAYEAGHSGRRTSRCALGAAK